MCLKALPKTRIMNFPVFSTFICLIVSYVDAVENTIPVLMLDYDQVMAHVQVERNPLKKIPFNDFAKIVDYSSKFKVIIFLEETFSVEDISTKDKFYGTPYKNLQANLLMDKNKVKYFPSVIQPNYVLRKKFPPKKDNVFYLAQRTKLQLKDSLKYIYMYFQDEAGETKADKLKRHDTIITEVLAALRAMKAGPIIAYYTGKLNTVTVKKVGTGKASKTESRRNGVFAQTPRVLIQLNGVHTSEQSRRFYYEQQPSVTVEIPSKHQMTTKMQLEELELKWEFFFEENSWTIQSVYLYEKNEAIGHAELNINVPVNRSYYCAEPLYILNIRKGDHLTIKKMLIDAMHQNKDKDKPYNPVYNCSPLYSSESLGCFVCAEVLVVILIGGLLVVMDCSTYDRFDDPNGKPLTHERTH